MELVDEFRLPVDPRPPSLLQPAAAGADLRITGEDLAVTGPKFAITFDRKTGLIKEATFAGQVLLIGGPYVDFGEGPLISNWLLRSCEAVAEDGTLTILTTGEGRRSDGAEPVPVVFEIEIDGRGLITTRYRIEDDGGGKNKIGLAYLLPATVDRLAWHRKALWSAYPEDHIGRP